MILRDPLFLLLLLILPLLALAVPQSRPRGKIIFSDTAPLADLPVTWKISGWRSLPWIRLAAMGLLVIALARPELGLPQTVVRRKGIDIVLTLDCSTSMLAEDFRTAGGRSNRLEVVKKVAGDFIRRRPNDRFGIVIFAGRPYILAPLTWDHDWSESRLGEVEAGAIEDGTAVGSALATAVNRLRRSDVKSKVIILLTDGMNNAGTMMPETAAQAAKALKVTVYTIGAGSKGPVPYPVADQYGRKAYRNLKIDIDEGLLRNIAATTGGRYFRATDAGTLAAVFRRIDKLEKTTIEMPQYREYLPLYPYFLWIALLLIIGETVLTNTVLRRLP